MRKNVGGILLSIWIVVIALSITLGMPCKRSIRSDRRKINIKGTSAAEWKKTKVETRFLDYSHECVCVLRCDFSKTRSGKP